MDYAMDEEGIDDKGSMSNPRVNLLEKIDLSIFGVKRNQFI